MLCPAARTGSRTRWIQVGFFLWIIAAGLGEAVLWPAERRVQTHLAKAGDDSGGAEPVSVEVREGCRAVLYSAIGIFALMIVATVVMVAQP